MLKRLFINLHRIDNLESKMNKILGSLQSLTESLKYDGGPRQAPRQDFNHIMFQRMDRNRNYRELVNPEYLLNASSPVGLVRNIEDRLYGKRQDLTSNIRSLGDVISHGYISEGTSSDLIEA